MRKHRFLSTFLSAALAIVYVTAPLPEMGIELEVPMTTDAVTYTELTDIPRNIDGNYAMPYGYYKLMNDITLDG